MAWQDWVSKTTTAVSNSYYKVVLTWRYRRDAVANKVQINTQYFTVYSLNSAYSFTSSSTVVGFWGPDITSSTGKTSTQSITCSGGSSVKVDTYDTTVDVECTTAGSIPSGTNFKWYFKPSVTITGWPVSSTSSWQSVAVSGVTQIDRTTGTGSISLTKSYSKITAAYSVDYAGDVYLKGAGESSYTKVGSLGTGGGSVSKTYTGLTPNTAYTIYGYHIRSYNELQSGTVSSSATTTAVATPSIPTLSSSDITETSFKVTMASGGTLYDSSTAYDGSYGKITYRVWNSDDENKADVITTTETTAAKLRAGITVTGLTPDTKYCFYVKDTAPLTSSSSTKSIYVTTDSISYDLDVGTVHTYSVTRTSFKFYLSSSAKVYDSSDGGSARLSYSVKDADGTQIAYSTTTASTIKNYVLISGLTPSTKYTITVYCYAPDGSFDYGSTTVTTLAETETNTVYYKTASGWQTGAIYVKTASGWQKGTPYHKTASGWQKGGSK
jgi:hypothetical protein